MTLAIIGSVILAIVVFAFVLEPVLRARGDRVVLDEVALPHPSAPVMDDEAVEDVDLDDEPEMPERVSRPRAQIDRPIGSDLT